MVLEFPVFQSGYRMTIAGYQTDCRYGSGKGSIGAALSSSQGRRWFLYTSLDARVAVPAAAVSSGSGSRGSVTPDPVNTNDARHEPEDGTEEDEGRIGLEGCAGVGSMEGDARPVEYISASTVHEVNEETEAHKPHDADEEIRGPVDERAAEGEEPKEGEQDREAGDDLGVDEASLVPGRAVGNSMEVVAGEASDDGREDQLRQAEDHGEQVSENHDDG